MGCPAVQRWRGFAASEQSGTIACVPFPHCQPLCVFQGLQNNLEGLKSHTEKLELQVNSLKAEKKRLEELDESRRAELCQ